MAVKNILKSLEIVKTNSRSAAKSILRVIRTPHIYFAIIANVIFILLLIVNLPASQIDSQVIEMIAAAASIALLDYVVLHSSHIRLPGLLSNVYSLFILSLITYIATLLYAGSMWIALCVGLVVTLNSALWGDLFLKGNYDSWLWVLRDNQILWLRRVLGSHLVSAVSLFFLFVIGAYVVAFFDLWITFSPNSVGFAWILNWQWIRDAHSIGLVGTILLFALIIWLTANCLVAIRKYQLLSSKSHLRLGTESMEYIWRKLVKKDKNVSLNRIIKQIQRDQLLWALILAVLITILETAIFLAYPNQGLFFDFFFFMTPLTIVLFFGIIGHTTSCELGGAYGVLLSALVVRLIVMIWPQYSWNTELVFLIFSSAIFAWIIGLFGGNIIRGTQRMSLLAFVIRVDFENRSTCVPDFLRQIQDSLVSGYRQGMKYIGDVSSNDIKSSLKFDTGLSITTEDDLSVLGDKGYTFHVSYNQMPLLKQVFYSLCLNRLTQTPGDTNPVPVPTLPLEYYHPGSKEQSEPDAVGMPDGMYYFPFTDRARPVHFPSFVNNAKHTPVTLYGYSKDTSQFFDNMLTLSVNIRTDLFLYVNNRSDQQGSATELCFVGFCRGKTSTKSYVTLESEILANEVVNSLVACLGQFDLRHQHVQRARLYYPKISIYDHVNESDEAGAPASPSSTPLAVAIPASVLEVIRTGLQQLPEDAPLTTFTDNMRKRLLVSIGEVSAAGIVTLFGRPLLKLLQAVLNNFLS